MLKRYGSFIMRMSHYTRCFNLAFLFFKLIYLQIAADHLLHELDVRLVFKAQLRLVNQRAANSRPDERHFATLDSNLKRNSGFVRKLVSCKLII